MGATYIFSKHYSGQALALFIHCLPNDPGYNIQLSTIGAVLYSVKELFYEKELEMLLA